MSKQKLYLKALIASIKSFIKELQKKKWEIRTKEICKEMGLNEGDTALICAVIDCESGFQTDIRNKNKDGSWDNGIIQANDNWYWKKEQIIHPEEAINNPEKAIRIMVKHYKQGRIKDWVCYSKGLYKRRMWKFI